jgi:hypothetical protein
VWWIVESEYWTEGEVDRIWIRLRGSGKGLRIMISRESGGKRFILVFELEYVAREEEEEEEEEESWYCYR